MNPDFGRTAKDYARYRAGFPEQLFERLKGFGIGIEGQRLLDLGTGTGALARAFAKRGCEVVGLDPSEEQIAEAKRSDSRAGSTVRYVKGIAEVMGFPDDTFDVVTAGVCWHWFDAKRAATEVRRILAPNGRLVIVHFDWLSADGNVVEATERLIRRYSRRPFWRTLAASAVKSAIEKFKPAWSPTEGTGIYPVRLATLAATGFKGIESFSFDAAVRYSHEAWRGRVRSHGEVGASQDRARVERLDAELESLLRARFPEDPLFVPHRVFAVIGSAP